MLFLQLTPTGNQTQGLPTQMQWPSTGPFSKATPFHHSVWSCQYWKKCLRWPGRLNLLIKNPVMIPNSKHLLRDPASPMRIHPMYPRLHLAVFQLSGKITKQKGFQRTLPEYWNQQLVPPHIRHTSQPGDYGIAGVLNGKLIHFSHPQWCPSLPDRSLQVSHCSSFSCILLLC